MVLLYSGTAASGSPEVRYSMAQQRCEALNTRPPETLPSSSDSTCESNENSEISDESIFQEQMYKDTLF